MGYTAATGKRPFRACPGYFGWADMAVVGVDAEDMLPGAIHDRLEGGVAEPPPWRVYRGRKTALAAADAAYERAVADGAMEPIEGVA